MEAEGEAAQIDQVIERLMIRHPTVPPAEVEHVVRSVYARFIDGKVREFIPLLVEKAARRRLAEHIPPVVEHVAPQHVGATGQSAISAIP